MTTPRDWADIPTPDADAPIAAPRGVVIGLALSVPLWAVIGWAVAYGPGWVLSSDWLWNGWCLR